MIIISIEVKRDMGECRRDNNFCLHLYMWYVHLNYENDNLFNYFYV